jgi:hypothetical protein
MWTLQYQLNTQKSILKIILAVSLSVMEWERKQAPMGLGIG